MSEQANTAPAQDTTKAGDAGAQAGAAGNAAAETKPSENLANNANSAKANAGAAEKPKKGSLATDPLENPGAKAPGEGGKPPEGKGQESDAKAPVAPEKYDLKLPKDSFLAQADLERIAADAKALELTNEQAQALLEREHQAISRFAKNQSESLERQGEVWMKESQADKEIGGEKLPATRIAVRRALDAYGDKEFEKILEDSGLGNNRHLLKLLAFFGNKMGNDKAEMGGTARGGGPVTLGRALYSKVDK
jgi:hypothetical protein